MNLKPGDLCTWKGLLAKVHFVENDGRGPYVQVHFSNDEEAELNRLLDAELPDSPAVAEGEDTAADVDLQDAEIVKAKLWQGLSRSSLGLQATGNTAAEFIESHREVACPCQVWPCHCFLYPTKNQSVR